jgi:hypothetical protein
VYWAVRRSLLTPFGLRTLDPEDPRYRGRADGDERRASPPHTRGPFGRGSWGPFADAHFRVFGNTEDSRRTMRALLAPLRAHVRETAWARSPRCSTATRRMPRGAASRRRGASERSRGCCTRTLRGGE